ncbi:MAG: polyisoprenoid-binding protein [Melioribacteraceae bacterium]|nr:MAG: polyisoprenoid-binding protein [Melioribacteraceae bacterium]
MKKITLFAIFIFAAASTFAQTKWTFDKSHSSVGFSVTHLIISEVEGNFKNFDGTVETNGDDFIGAKVEFTVDTKSIDTDNEQRDNHLRSDDFFNAEKFPQMIFKSKSFKKAGDKKYKLIGELTIRDITKEVTLDVKHNGTVKDPWGNTKAGFKITGEINRFDYGLKWNALMEAGGAVVGESVNLEINIQLAKAKNEA